MSELLDALIAQRKENALDYQDYLAQIVELTRKAQQGPTKDAYPVALDSAARRALYDNLGKDEALALKVDGAVRDAIQDAWRENKMKTRRVRQAVEAVLGADDGRLDAALDLIRNQDDY